MGEKAYVTGLKSRLTQASTRKKLQSPVAVPQNLPSGVIPYFEEEPTIKEWLSSFKITQKSITEYLCSLFPFTSWLKRYNAHWLLGDGIAGMG